MVHFCMANTISPTQRRFKFPFPAGCTDKKGGTFTARERRAGRGKRRGNGCFCWRPGQKWKVVFWCFFVISYDDISIHLMIPKQSQTKSCWFQKIIMLCQTMFHKSTPHDVLIFSNLSKEIAQHELKKCFVRILNHQQRIYKTKKHVVNCVWCVYPYSKLWAGNLYTMYLWNCMKLQYMVYWGTIVKPVYWLPVKFQKRDTGCSR